MSNPAAIAEMIHTNPSMQQAFIKAFAQHDPALGQQLSQNPALLDSFIHKAKIEVVPNHPIGVLTPEEKCAIERVSDILLYIFSSH